MMTIKEFARLCACNTQTLRYYDRIDLLKPVQVDRWSGYRYYDSKQAIDFVKIKNLQAADFTIEEIKRLLTLSDQQVYEAFDIKIAEQSQKLERIREIQQSYLAEKNTMEQIIYSMTDYFLSQCAHPEILTEFGMGPEDASTVLTCLRSYMNSIPSREVPEEGISMTINGEVVHGHAEVLNCIQSLTQENMTDTIELNTGIGYSMEHNTDPDLYFETDYEVIWERTGWAHVYEFIDEIPRLKPDETYCLRLQTNNSAYPGDLSAALFLMGTVLHKQQLEDVAVNCSVSSDANMENCFKLLRKI